MRTDDHHDDLLRRFEEHIASDPAFSKEEAAMLRQIMEAYRAWSVLGRGARWLVMGLATISAGLVAWEHLMGQLKRWLTS